MKSVRLKDVCKISNGYAFKSEDYKSEGTPLVRISNFDDSEVIIDEKSVFVDTSFIDSKKDFIINKGDILIALSGATTGKYGIYNFDYPSLLNQRIGIIKSGESEELFHKYFYHYLNILKEEILRNAGGAAQPNISTKTIGDLKIPLPPLDQQKKIASILDAADAYRQKTKALISKYDELTQSLFLDMFGDPVKNEKGWEIDSLKNHGNFKNGLNYSKSEKGVKVKCLGVGDFKSLYRIESIENLSELNLTQLPSNDFLLKNGDLVFVRSNGNKELVGRCLAVYPNDLKLTFSGFCIRYRIESLQLTSDYLAHLFRTKIFKNSMIEEGRGANIQNINQQILANLKIPLPKTNLQTEFADRVKAIEQQKAKAQESLEKAEELFNSLLQKAFNGELVEP